MVRIVFWVTTALLLLATIAAPAAGCKEKAKIEPKKQINFGTGVAADDELDALSRAVVRAIEKRLPQFDVVSIENPGGTAEVIKDVARYHLCGLSLDEAAQAYYGFFAWKGQPRPQLRLLWVMGILPVAFVVAADTGIKSIYDLEGKPYGDGGKENRGDFKVTKFLEVLNIKPLWNRDSWAAQVDLYQQQKLTGFVKYGALEPLLVKSAESRPFVILELSESDLIKANQRYQGTGLTYPSCLIRVGTYPGQEKNITTFGLMLGYYTQQELPPEIAYSLTKAVWQDVWDVSVCYKPLELDIIGFPKLTLEQAPFPLHSGAVKFYRELGLEVPERLVPPEMR